MNKIFATRTGLAAARTVVGSPYVARPAASRGMATLQETQIRIRATTNIQKITKSMKMVAAAKLRRAQKMLDPAREYENGSKGMWENLDTSEQTTANHLIIGITSDKGLCGGANSTISKYVIKQLKDNKANNIDSKIVIVGEKGKAAISKAGGDDVLFAVDGIQKGGMNYAVASKVMDLVTAEGYSYDKCSIVYNKFKSMIAYETEAMDVPSFAKMELLGEQLTEYETEGDNDMENLQTMRLADAFYNCMLESATSEQSSRMSSMENASNNAKDMIDSLTILYNRTRQAVITSELIEIISGASAL